MLLATSHSSFHPIRVSMRSICATVGCEFSIVNISSAIFDCSAPDSDSYPDESLPEFAFIGRSNVGKSSLLNMLAGEQNMARVSSTPGFTKLINIFTMNKCWRLVDLPGYGFAQIAREHKARFNVATADYLEHRTNLCLVFALIDSGLTPQEIDLEFVEWLMRHAVPFVLVFTKADKVPAATVQTNIAAFTDRISAWFDKLPAMFTCSAETGQGRQELLGVIDEQLRAISAASSLARVHVETLSPQTRIRENRKRRPDLNRPW
jgi:GTP-binding protein